MLFQTLASTSRQMEPVILLAKRPSAHTTRFNEFVHKRPVLCFGDWRPSAPSSRRLLPPLLPIQSFACEMSESDDPVFPPFLSASAGVDLYGTKAMAPSPFQAPYRRHWWLNLALAYAAIHSIASHRTCAVFLQPHNDWIKGSCSLQRPDATTWKVFRQHRARPERATRIEDDGQS